MTHKQRQPIPTFRGDPPSTVHSVPPPTRDTTRAPATRSPIRPAVGGDPVGYFVALFCALTLVVALVALVVEVAWFSSFALFCAALNAFVAAALALGDRR